MKGLSASRMTTRLSVVREINKESWLAAMGKGEHPTYQRSPIIRARGFGGNQKDIVVTLKSGDEIQCGIDDVEVSW